jgi:hypothetical protein
MNAVHKLEAFKEKIVAEKRTFYPAKFVGQAWGGANCMVISSDLETQNFFKHFKGEILSTTYPREIGNLYNSIKDLLDESSGYDHLTKLELWGEITIAGRDFIESTPNYDLTSLKLNIINKAIDVIKRWQ